MLPHPNALRGATGLDSARDPSDLQSVSGAGVADGARLSGVQAAIVHDWFQGYHGSEQVVEVMRTRLFDPDSGPDVLAFSVAREVLPPGLAESIVRVSRLSRLPGLSQQGERPGRWRYLLPYMPYYFRYLDLKAYELVISSSHAFAFHARPRSEALHICYCHTPARYVWLPDVDERSDTGRLADLGLRVMRPPLRWSDRRAATHPNVFVANSSAVRKRIQVMLRRDAIVIPPPVRIEQFSPGDRVAGHFIWVHRMVSYKRPELVMEAFRGLPLTLTMIGGGPLAQVLRERCPPNVEVLGHLSDEELRRRLSESSGFIHVGEEDFGMSMVEALASGVPVLALRKGGAVDIVRDGIDGILIEDATIPSIREGLALVCASNWSVEDLVSRAREFSPQKFSRRMLQLIADLRPDLVAEHQGVR